jgi:Bifunctional DNA primase/polymerase, N-terminal/Primase C terminal 1 (PriCT-1)
MTGRFSTFQPLYAEQGITAIPCSTDAKKPLVSHYLKMGIPASKQLALRFTDVNALGIVCGAHNRITVLDIDSADPGIAKEAFRRHGEPKVIVRTASGKLHGYFRYNGEGRKIRPWKDLPIDILGGGFVMAVPSLFGPGEYHFAQGGLGDLSRLTTLVGIEQNIEPKAKPAPHVNAVVNEGRRTTWMLRECLRASKSCESYEALIEVARARNQSCNPPMTEGEIMKTVDSAWRAWSAKVAITSVSTASGSPLATSSRCSTTATRWRCWRS